MNNTIIILALLAGLVSLQYWRGRKINLSIIRRLANELERILQPVEKEYIWIGGYVGVIAEYELKKKEFSGVKATISLLPRHSFLYFPFSLLIGRRDRVYLLIKSGQKLTSRVHLKPGKRARKPAQVEDLEHDTVQIGRTVLKRWYDDLDAAEELTGVIKGLADPSGVKHIAVNKEENAYYAEVKITHNAPVKLIKAFLRSN